MLFLGILPKELDGDFTAATRHLRAASGVTWEELDEHYRNKCDTNRTLANLMPMQLTDQHDPESEIIRPTTKAPIKTTWAEVKRNPPSHPRPLCQKDASPRCAGSNRLRVRTSTTNEFNYLNGMVGSVRDNAVPRCEEWHLRNAKTEDLDRRLAITPNSPRNIAQV